MSRYDWEQGTLTVPSKEWALLKKRLREGWNAILLKRFELAVALHAHLVAAGKGKRNFDYVKAAEAWADSKASSSGYGSLRIHMETGESIAASNCIGLVLGTDYSYGPAAGSTKIKPKTPKKKDLPLANAKTISYGDQPVLQWDGHISLSDKSRQLHWRVHENNHAVEHAWDHPMGKVLDSALRQVVWTRGSGGEFVGNDEYNRDSRGAGDAANYVTRNFGQQTKAASSRARFR